MKKNVYDYFINIENLRLPKKSRIFHLEKSKDVTKLESDEEKNLPKYNICGIPHYAKSWDFLVPGESLLEISASKMYNEIGILTPPYAPAFVKTSYSPELRLISQDIKSLPELIVSQAIQIPEYQKIIDPRRSLQVSCEKWDIIYYKTIRALFLEFMTEDCLNELVTIYLADELRTDGDRNLSNFYLYKSPESEKYEGVITFDLESTEIILIGKKDEAKENFPKFIKDQYCTFTPFDQLDYKTYEERIKAIKGLIQAGKLTDTQTQILHDELTYDFPNETKKLCRKYGFKKEAILLHDALSYLWEYNRNSLREDLSL